MIGLRTQKTCRDSPKPKRIDNMSTTIDSQERDTTATTNSKASKGNSIIRRRADTKTSYKYELTTKFMGGNTKLFAKNWNKHRINIF